MHPKYLLIAMSALMLSACTTYYMVKDPQSGQQFYTTSDLQKKGQAVVFKDAASAHKLPCKVLRCRRSARINTRPQSRRPRNSICRREMNRDPNGTATRPVSIEPGCHTRYHIVKRGETLAMIAATYFGDPALARALFEANSDVLPAPDAVVSGQTLRIPHRVEVDR